MKSWLFPEKIIPKTLENLPGVEIEEVLDPLLPPQPHIPVRLKYQGKEVFGFFFFDSGKIRERDSWEEIDLGKILEYLEDPVRKNLKIIGRSIYYRDQKLPEDVYWWEGKLWEGEKEWLKR